MVVVLSSAVEVLSSTVVVLSSSWLCLWREHWALGAMGPMGSMGPIPWGPWGPHFPTKCAEFAILLFKIKLPGTLQQIQRIYWIQQKWWQQARPGHYLPHAPGARMT